MSGGRVVKAPDKDDKPFIVNWVNNLYDFFKGETQLQRNLDKWFSNALTGDLDYQRQISMLEREQAFNSAEAEKNRQFNLDMSNTAYSRQAEDLKRSGYNPALVLSGGGANVVGTNTPYASQQASGYRENLLPLVGSIVSSAFNFASNSLRNQTALNIANLKANNSAEIAKMRADTSTEIAKMRNNNKKIINVGTYTMLPDISSKNKTLKDADYDSADDLTKALIDLFLR